MYCCRRRQPSCSNLLACLGHVWVCQCEGASGGHAGRGVLPVDSRGMRWEGSGVVYAIWVRNKSSLRGRTHHAGIALDTPRVGGARVQRQVKERHSRTCSVSFEWLRRMPEQSVELVIIVMHLRVNVFRTRFKRFDDLKRIHLPGCHTPSPTRRRNLHAEGKGCRWAMGHLA
jgi:hypothetical protein